MPPKRAATASSRSSRKSVRRPHHGWHNDSASKHSRSSLDVLLGWLTTPGNYSRWAARSAGPSTKSSGEGRLSLCKEVNALLQREGITHRKDMDVYAKIVVIEKSFHAAKKWLEETALMPKFLHGTAGKDVEANVNQLCRHYKELAPAFAATNNETAASEVVDIDDDDEEDDGGKSDTTTSTDDAEEKPRASNGQNNQVGTNETNDASGGEQGPPSRDDIANESIDEMSSSQPELYTLSPVHDKTTVAVSITTTTTSVSTTASPQQQKQSEENRTPRIVQHDEYEETKENGPPEPDSPLQESQRSLPSPGSSNKFKRIRQRIASELSDDETEPPVSSSSPQQQQQKQQQGTPVAPPSSTTFTKVLATVQRGDVGSPAREKAAVIRLIEKPSIAPKRKTSGMLKDAIAATSAELSSPSARKKQKTQWTEQQELKKQLQQEEEKLVKQLQQEYLKKQEQQEELRKKKQRQEELSKKKQLHQEELKKKHQQRQEELSKKRQQEYERKQQQELEEQKRKQQRREDLLVKKKQQQEEEAAKKANAISTQVVAKSQDQPAIQHQMPKPPRHPEELQAILRACEDEREQRHALFQLQCDKLLQELEEKKIKVVYETALARKKLLDIGVAQSEVDRILPL